MSVEKGDQSIEEIFESIRQIMSENESVGQPAPTEEDILELTDVAGRDEEHVAAARSGDRVVAFSGMDGRAALLSEAAKAASLSSFVTLASEVVSRRDAADSSAEDLVKDVMRPLIREWLDANFPALVERLVEREIRRLAGTAEDRTG